MSDLPARGFMVLPLLLLVTHLPEVETCPEEEHDDSKRQAQHEVYLHRAEMGVWIGSLSAYRI